MRANTRGNLLCKLWGAGVRAVTAPFSTFNYLLFPHELNEMKNIFPQGNMCAIACGGRLCLPWGAGERTVNTLNLMKTNPMNL